MLSPAALLPELVSIDFDHVVGPYTGNSLADVLLGFPFQTRRRLGDTRNPIRSWSYSGYIQDDWKATPRLTFNLGLRYDLNTVVTSTNDRMSVFDPVTGNILIAGNPSARRDISRPDLDIGGPDFSPEIADLSAGVTFVDLGESAVWGGDHNNLGPRFGLAYRLLDNDTLVLRTGYGIFYNLLALNAGISPSNNYPFKVDQTFNASTSSPNISIENPFPLGLGRASNAPAGHQGDFRTGYVQHFNFGIQYQPLSDLVFDISYVGSKSTKLDIRRNINQALFGDGPVSSWASRDARRPFQGFGNITMRESAGLANFRVTQVGIRIEVCELFDGMILPEKG